MEHPDGSAWVFDSLVGFLHGPVWNVPLQTFIEEKSLRKCCTLCRLLTLALAALRTYLLFVDIRNLRAFLLQLLSQLMMVK